MQRLPTALPAIPMILLASFTSLCWAQSACAPPATFRATPHPAVAPAAELISRTEEIVIARRFAVVAEAMDRPLQQALQKSDSLPGVSGEYALTRDGFGTPGTRRYVCLTDGTGVEEEVLERAGTNQTSLFRYVVWNYTTPKARPIAYGVGEFHTVQMDPSHTRITWTYSFKLKGNVFPGSFGALGRWLFRVGFLDRDYAEMMRGVLNEYKSAAESGTGSAAH